MHELRQLGVRRPRELEKFLHLFVMVIAVVFRKERIGITNFMMDEFLESISTRSTTRRCGRPAMQSNPGRAAGPDPLAAMIKLFTRPGKFCVAASAMRPPMEWPKRCAAEIFR